MNSLECVEYVSRVGVVSEVEFHICCCPSVWTTRLYKLGQQGRRGNINIWPSVSLVFSSLIFCFFLIIHTFSTRSMKKSLTSFVLVNFAAILTRPLERFCNLLERLHSNVLLSYYFCYSIYFFQLSLQTMTWRRTWWWKVSHLEISFHLSKCFRLSSESRTDQTKFQGRIEAEENHH